jgi:ATP-dependent DNA helicase RecG
MKEGEKYDKKSLSTITGKNPGWKEIAKDCVGFANARGGIIAIGIEDKEDLPPSNQKINSQQVDTLRKRISELTVNVACNLSIEMEENGGEWIKIQIYPSQTSVASTTDGQYYIRISDHCKPVLPDELSRLFTDKPAFIWETKIVQKITIDECDQAKLNQFESDIKKAKRVSDFVKEKSIKELLLYYQMYDGIFLTNLGILWIGTSQQRAKLLYAPVVQFIKYNNNGNKVKKEVWDDFSMNPKELFQSMWEKIPEWKEGIEISGGIFGREKIYNYHEDIVRELFANALVHRPYTTRGDVFINLYPDRLEIHNPGLLPLGVTPNNILHQSVRRNDHLSKIFYDLNLMEREGSGYDKIYEIQLSEAKQLPIVEEKDDRVIVTIYNQIKDPNIILLIDNIKQRYQLNQKEIICLGIIAQHKNIIATEFARQIQSKDDKQIKHWLGNLLSYEIVLTKGRTKGMQYYLNPNITKDTSLGKTDLSGIEEHRLKSLLLEDIEKYPNSSIEEIHNRIGKEIPIRKLRTCLYRAVKNDELQTIGGKKYRKYFIDKNKE